MSSNYKTCDNYCAAQGLICIGAHEDQSNNCKIEDTYTCDFDFSTLSNTSDAICECRDK